MTYLAISLTLVCLGLLWLYRDQSLRHGEERRTMLKSSETERQALADRSERERQILLDRIQRPEIVPPANEPEGPPEQGWIDVDDDDAYAREMARLNGGTLDDR